MRNLNQFRFYNWKEGTILEKMRKTQMHDLKIRITQILKNHHFCHLLWKSVVKRIAEQDVGNCIANCKCKLKNQMRNAIHLHSLCSASGLQTKRYRQENVSITSRLLPTHLSLCCKWFDWTSIKCCRQGELTQIQTGLSIIANHWWLDPSVFVCNFARRLTTTQ